MKNMRDEAVEAFMGLLAVKKWRHRFSSEEAWQRVFDEHLASIPSELKLEVCAQAIFYEARSYLVADLWRERWTDRHRNIADTLLLRKRRHEWFETIWFSEPIYNAAYRVATELQLEVDRAAFTLKVIVRWLEYARTLWDGGFGDAHSLAAMLDASVMQANQQLEHHRASIERSEPRFQTEARQRLAEMEQELGADLGLAQIFPTNLLGKRGSAMISHEAAARGWLIRKLNRLLPPFKTERYAIIAGLLGLAGVTGLSAQLVRATLKSGRT
jgi:hypothetical protein